MKKKIPPINLFIPLLFISLLVHFSIPAYAQEVNTGVTEEYDYKKNPYYISSYHTDVIVNADNSFQVTEKISVFFNKERHGLIRTIPLNNEVIQVDGRVAAISGKISDISVNEEYSLSREDDCRILQIGEADKMVIGAKDYTISYLYDLADDKSKDYDALYFNLFENGWGEGSQNVSFTITMPKGFEHEKVGFFNGTNDSIDDANITYTIEGNVIKGNLTRAWESSEALAIRVELEEGYFVKGPLRISREQLLLFITPLVGMLLAFLLWWRYGKDRMVVTSVEFYPPGNFNSLEIAYLYKGFADDADVISLMVYLANKGYLEISETHEQTIFMSNSSFVITKLKEYDGINISEKLFLEGLFPSGKTSITAADLYNKFYLTIKEIRGSIQRPEVYNTIFEKSNKKRSIYFYLLIFVMYFVGVGIPTLEYGDIQSLAFNMGLSLFFLPFLSVLFVENLPLLFKVVWGIAVVPTAAISFMNMPIGWAIKSDVTYLLGVIACIIGIVVVFVFLKLLPKRTVAGAELLGKIRGFKEFLETADKERMEALVMENPAYFYDILPYTYVLEVSNVWIEKLNVDSIAFESPQWYYGDTSFDTGSFQYSMNSMNSTMTVASQPPPEQNSRRRSSNNRSSGRRSSGGRGGGGDGSW